MSCESRVGGVWMNKSHLSTSIPSLHRRGQICEQRDRVSSTVIHRLSTLCESRRMEPSQMVDHGSGGLIRDGDPCLQAALPAITEAGATTDASPEARVDGTDAGADQR
ncbi:hypothetical protein GCM10009706_26950 [Curtobacterium citreum]|nr:hypothetical protein GCM10009706_26950 [Curtobacterium citreum]